MDDIKIFAKSEDRIETLIQTLRIYCQDIGKEFGIERFVILIMKSGKRVEVERIERPNQKKKKKEMKEIIKKECWVFVHSPCISD